MSDRWDDALGEVRRRMAYLERGIAKLQGLRPDQPKEPRPEPEHEGGEWFVSAGDATHINCITGRRFEYGDWRYEYDQWSSGKRQASGRSWSCFVGWLPIPPRPEAPEGHRFKGEVRVTRKGDWFVTSDGKNVCYAKYDGDSHPGYYGGRRWILEKLEPQYRKGQLVHLHTKSGDNYIGYWLGRQDGCERLQLLNHEVFCDATKWYPMDVRPAKPSDLTKPEWMNLLQAEVDRNEKQD